MLNMHQMNRENSRSGYDHYDSTISIDVVLTIIITHSAGSRRGGFFSAICLCVCLLFRTISEKTLQLGSPNLTQKCSTTMTPGNSFIFAVKDQKSRLRVTKTMTV